jgi:ABC-type glutathione transport system ATPase component
VSQSWPEQGAVEFTEYTTAYREELAPVLAGFSLAVRPGEKVGLVGRTGAGKSSLGLALFRILEPRAGSLLIDGVDTASIGLQGRRSFQLWVSLFFFTRLRMKYLPRLSVAYVLDILLVIKNQKLKFKSNSKRQNIECCCTCTEVLEKGDK